MDTNWLDAFDADDVLRFRDEIAAAQSADEVRTIVHEWHESALAPKPPKS